MKIILFDKNNTAQEMKLSVKDFLSHIYWRNPQWKTSVFVQCKSFPKKLIPGKTRKIPENLLRLYYIS